MDKLTRDDLMTLEAYAEKRTDFRAQVMEHKKNRQVHLGEHCTLYFEDRLTMQYQVQEMLRVERIFEADGIQEELDAYNPLIPDGSNWKATFMIEYPDVEQRKVALEKLVGVEDRVWVRVGHAESVFAIADEDLERSDDVKTSSVHFMRFELPDVAVSALFAGADISMGIDHPECQQEISPIPANIRDALVADLGNH